VKCEVCESIKSLHLDPRCHALFTCSDHQAFAGYFLELSQRTSQLVPRENLPLDTPGFPMLDRAYSSSTTWLSVTQLSERENQTEKRNLTH